MTDDGSVLTLIDWIVQKLGRKYLDMATAPAEHDFDAELVSLFDKTITQLEANKSNFATLDEVALSGAVAMGLTVPGLVVTQEGHTNGHVDLTISTNYCVPTRRRLAEAKIYDGPTYHLKGLEQLFSRYMTGREGSGILIVYFRKKNVAGLVAKTRRYMDDQRPLRQRGMTTDHKLRWCFCSVHAHGSGEAIGVSHIACNLYIEPSGTVVEA